jgi:S1-C subfamily serine protease
MSRRLLVTGLFVLTALASAPAADKAAAPLSGKEIYQRALKSAVWIAHAIEVGNGKAVLATGSGSVIDIPRRLVLTNFHVVGREKIVQVFFPQFDKQNKLIAAKEHYFQLFQANKGFRGEVIAVDEKRDLALIKLADKLPPGTTAVPLAKEGVGPGDSVHSIGNPGASDALWAYTPGSVKAVYRKNWSVKERNEMLHFEAQVVETTSPVNPGDSGGPLVNSQGELVAVTQGGVSAQGTISYFIDVSEVRALLTAKKIQVAPGPPAMVASNVEPKPVATAPKEPEVSQAEKDEKTAKAKLHLAMQMVNDRPERAKERFDEIIKQYPTTKAAGEAKDWLEKLKK